MHFVLAFLACLLGLAACSAPQSPARSSADLSGKSPGDVLSENWISIAGGYREVARSQVNGPGAFEGVGHFRFVYFGEEKLCQCDRTEVAIAPGGEYAVYTDVRSGKLTLFNSTSRTRSDLSSAYVGYPKSAVWDLPHGKVIVTVEAYVDGKSSTRTVESSF